MTNRIQAALLLCALTFLALASTAEAGPLPVVTAGVEVYSCTGVMPPYCGYRDPICTVNHGTIPTPLFGLGSAMPECFVEVNVSGVGSPCYPSSHGYTTGGSEVYYETRTGCDVPILGYYCYIGDHYQGQTGPDKIACSQYGDDVFQIRIA